MNIVVIWYCKKKKMSLAQVHRRVYMCDSLLLWIFSLIHVFTRSFNLLVYILILIDVLVHFLMNFQCLPVQF